MQGTWWVTALSGFLRSPWNNDKNDGTWRKVGSYQLFFFFLLGLIFRFCLFFLVCRCFFLFLLFGNRRHVGIDKVKTCTDSWDLLPSSRLCSFDIRAHAFTRSYISTDFLIRRRSFFFAEKTKSQIRSQVSFWYDCMFVIVIWKEGPSC